MTGGLFNGGVPGVALRLLHTAAELRQWRQGWERPAGPLQFVPTMGGLHQGHQSLVALADRARAAHGGQVLLSVSGRDMRRLADGRGSTETMAPVIVNLASLMEREVFVRVVDDQAGGAWGHVNFDDFKFYATRPALAGAVEVTAGR